MIYSPAELKQVDKKTVPAHIAFIMDGNRRWAKKHLLSIADGHRRGVNALTNVVKAAADIGVRVMTAYAFSTENWNRPKWEVEALIHLFHSFLVEKEEELKAEGICFDTIGDLSAFPSSLQNLIAQVKESTAVGKRMELVLALNYGARDEMRRAWLKMYDAAKEGLIVPQQITENDVSKFLDTAKWPDPDMLIRTSGEKRLSNFMLWQLSYAEVYVTTTLWPDFTPKDLLDAIIDFQSRKRRWGV